MRNFQDLVWQMLFAVSIVFFGGWVLGSVLNLLATASPQMVSVMFCPTGSTAAWTTNEDQSRTISCTDKGGNSVPALSEDESIVLQRRYFYRPSYLVMIVLVIGWFIWSHRRSRVSR